MGTLLRTALVAALVFWGVFTAVAVWRALFTDDSMRLAPVVMAVFTGAVLIPLAVINLKKPDPGPDARATRP